MCWLVFIVGAAACVGVGAEEKVNHLSERGQTSLLEQPLNAPLELDHGAPIPFCVVCRLRFSELRSSEVSQSNYDLVDCALLKLDFVSRRLVQEATV